MGYPHDYTNTSGPIIGGMRGPQTAGPIAPDPRKARGDDNPMRGYGRMPRGYMSQVPPYVSEQFPPAEDSAMAMDSVPADYEDPRQPGNMRDRSAVDINLGDLGTSVDTLHKLVAVLEERLAPVLRPPHQPLEGSCEAKGDVDPSSPVARSVRATTRLVALAGLKLEDIINRIDV